MVLGVLPLVPVLYKFLQPQHTQSHHHAAFWGTHSSCNERRLPMVLGMVPLMPVLYNALQCHSTLSHVSNQHSFTQHSALLTAVSVR